MKNSLCKASLAIGLMLVGSGFVNAETIKVSPCGRSAVYSYILYNQETCTSLGKPQITLHQPAHGTLSSVWTTLVLDGKGCNGKKFKGYLIYYTPKGGFHGKDPASFALAYANFINGPIDTSRRINLDIEVK